MLLLRLGEREAAERTERLEWLPEYDGIEVFREGR